MNQQEIFAILRNTPNLPHIHELSEIRHDGHPCKGIYRGHSQDSSFSIKIRKHYDPLTQSSISALEEVEFNPELYSPYLHIIEAESNLILIKEWELGKTIDRSVEQFLPEYFAKLARFNIRNVSDGNYISMYADGRFASSISDLISHEIKYHLGFWKDEISKRNILELIEPLYSGFGCIISEDNNLANLIFTENRQIRLIDLDWIQRGPNLYQFDRFSFFTKERKNRHSIYGALAKECYAAYFSEMSGSISQANDQIRAIEVLSVLRKNTYNRFFEKQDQYGNEIKHLQEVEFQHSFI